MPSLALRLIGLLAFMGAAALLACAIFGIAYAIGTRNGRLAGRIALGAGAIAAGYTLLLIAGPLLTRSRTLAPGGELSFCGFDCHLHVSATSERRDDSLDVTLRLRSDAKAAPEYPGELLVVVADAAGREFRPEQPLPADALPAGAAVSRTLRFIVPADIKSPRLLVTWSDWQDYLVPGPQNPLVQRKAALQLASGDAESDVVSPR